MLAKVNLQSVLDAGPDPRRRHAQDNTHQHAQRGALSASLRGLHRLSTACATAGTGGIPLLMKRRRPRTPAFLRQRLAAGGRPGVPGWALAALLIILASCAALAQRYPWRSPWSGFLRASPAFLCFTWSAGLRHRRKRQAGPVLRPHRPQRPQVLPDPAAVVEARW